MSALYLESFTGMHAEWCTHREHLIDHLIVHHLHRHGTVVCAIVTTSSVHDGALKRDSYSPWSCEGSGAPGSAWTQALGAPCLLPTTGDLSQHTRRLLRLRQRPTRGVGLYVLVSTHTRSGLGRTLGICLNLPQSRPMGSCLSPRPPQLGVESSLSRPSRKRSPSAQQSRLQLEYSRRCVYDCALWLC